LRGLYGSIADAIGGSQTPVTAVLSTSAQTEAHSTLDRIQVHLNGRTIDITRTEVRSIDIRRAEIGSQGVSYAVDELFRN
jgi:hypothetical protein